MPGRSEPARKSAEIESLLRGSMLRGASSLNLDWDGFEIERHTVQPGEKPERHSDHYFIVVSAAHSGHCERADENGRRIPHSSRLGSITLFSSGTIAALHVPAIMEVIVGAVNPSLIASIEDRLERRTFESVHEKINFQDTGLRTLTSLLMAESDAGGPCGRLYADCLTHALATRIVLQLRRAIEPREGSKSGFPLHILRRVLERMNSEFSDDLSLAALAAESGYSRAHFLRIFRAATGQTPHQYLLSVRLEKALQMLNQRSTPLVEVALACGFSSHTHFTKAFHSRFGVLPSQYRRRPRGAIT